MLVIAHDLDVIADAILVIDLRTDGGNAHESAVTIVSLENVIKHSMHTGNAKRGVPKRIKRRLFAVN